MISFNMLSVLRHLFKSFQALPWEPKVELTLEDLLRMGMMDAILQQPQHSIEAWAREQASRLSKQTIIASVPWWYPVHPGVIQYFVVQQWWTIEDVRAHVLRLYPYGKSFGGNGWHPFRSVFANKLDIMEMAHWCAQLLQFDLTPVVKASLLGHIIDCVGVEQWCERVQPHCAAHIGDVDMDVLFAVYALDSPAGVAHALSPALDDAIRHVVFPENDENEDEAQLLQMHPGHPHLALELMLVEQHVCTDLELYRIGAYLKRLENDPAPSFALPDGLLATHD